MGRKKLSLEEQIHNIMKKYVDDVSTAIEKAVDKGAAACLTAVKADAPVCDKTIVRYKKTKENALVEKQFGNKRARTGTKKVYKPGYYRDGFAIRQDKDIKKYGLYGKKIKNIRQPHLTHLLENGHDLKNSNGEKIGYVEKRPHIVDNGNSYGERTYGEIDKFLRKGGKIKP